MKKSYIILLIFALLSIRLHAQTEVLYTVNAELPNSLITAIAQDSIGNIWIGSENGLCKFDGAKFTHYFHNASEQNSLLSDRVSAISVTDKGDVLIGTQLGLQRYDADFNRFENIPLHFAEQGPIPIHVSSIKSLPDGDIVLGTLGSGVMRVDTKIWEGKSVVDKKRRDIFVTELAVNPDNDVWLALAREGAQLAKWDDGKALEIMAVPGTNDWKIEDVVSDNIGNAYYATQYGVHKVSIQDLGHELLFDHPREKILSLSFDANGNLLLGAEGSGIICIDPSDGAIVDIPYYTGRTDISKAKVRNILIDRNNNLWLGLYQKGILVCQSQSNNFDFIGAGGAKDYIGSNAIMALYPDPKGTLWVAPDKDGLYAITGSEVRHYPQETNGLPALITTLHESSDGTLWVGSIDTGLAKLDRKTGRCSYIDGFRGKSVFDIVEDKNHNLWIATMGDGLFRCDKNGNIEYKAPSTDYRHYTPGSDLLHNTWINSLTLSEDSTRLYINTCYGVGCYDLDAASYVNVFGENRILVGEMCYDSYEDRDGYLWVATTNGVYRWHRDDDEILHLDTSHGLSNNTVVGITPDRDGNIWFATYYGLSNYDKSTGKLTNYYASDGIQGNEFSLRSMGTDSDGIIYAGGINGVSAFSTIDQKPKTPVLRITDVYSHDKPVNQGSKSGGKNIVYVDRDGNKVYEFDADDNSIGVEVATDQFNNHNVIYKYSIDSKEWSTLPHGNNKVYFSNLGLGKHTIAFKASSYGVESVPQYIHINIRSHWYFSWWAILLYIVFSAVAVWLIVRNLKKMNKMKSEILEQKKRDEFNNSTLQFLVNIAHEIRTPITLITNPISRLAEMHTDNDSQHLFSIIRNNINRIMLLANQLLDVRKIDHNQLVLKRVPTDLVEYTRRAMSLFDNMAEAKHISLELEAQPEKIYVEIDPLQFDKILTNLLSNAFKYTDEGGKISVDIKQDEKTATIIVKDNGTGIPDECIKHIFDRFYQAEDQRNYKHLGSGVGLHLTKLLVTMHEGSIDAHNNTDGKGVQFIIQIPAVEEPAEDSQVAIEDSYTPLDSGHILEEDCGYSLMSTRLKSRKSVVIVEDNKDIRDYLHEQLQHLYNVFTFDNPKDALSYVMESKPDLLITDIVLNLGDGLTLIKNIRQNININDIPIIVLSAKHDNAIIKEAIDDGADLYMAKPFDIKLLITYIENLIKQRQKLRVIYSGNQTENNLKTVDTSTIKSPDDQFMDRLASAINKNISNPEYNIADLASDVCMSRVHLNRKLKLLTNQSPSTYLRNMRLSMAAQMLKEQPDLAVSDVATAVGMTSFSHFSHAFRDLYGCSPSEYASKSAQDATS